MARKNADRNYIVEALTNQYHLAFAVFLVGLSAVTWSWLPLVGLLGFEMLFLATVPGSTAFQRSVENKYLALAAEDHESELERRSQALPHEMQNRLERVSALIDAILDNVSKDKEGLLDGVEDRIRPFLERYLHLCEVRHGYQELMSQVSASSLEKDIREVEGQLEHASDRVARSLAERKNVLERRLERLRSVNDNASIIGHQLATIEDTLKLIRESTITVRNPAGISSALDDLLTEVEVAEEAVLDAEALVSSGSSTEDAERKLDAFDRALKD